MSGSADRPAGGSAGGRRGNLPAELTTFFGRDGELAELAAALESAQLVTVTGVGGVGKTHVALRAARRVRDRFPDGVWLVELSKLREADLLPHAVAMALDMQDQSTRPLIDVLADHLAGRQCLLVLDTCEHIIDACALLAATLISAAPRLRILATSRQPLAVQDERLVRLLPLPVPPDPDDCLPEDGAPAAAVDGAALLAYDAVRLFAARARAIDPGFTLTGANGSAVARVCRRLEGIPLALELAAPWLQSLPLDKLADRLDDRFRLLTRPARAEPDRHDALRTTIGWSHELCTPAERLLWARAAVFAGSFDDQAAVAVCAGAPLPPDGFRRVLAGLVRKSILLQQGHGRYRMLDTIREYGAQWRDELGETEVVRQRHRDYYRALAREASGEWLGARQIHWYRRIQDDHADIRVALEVCLTGPPVPGDVVGAAEAMAMAADLWFFWYGCGCQREGRHYLERALARDPDPGEHRARAAWAFGMIALSQGDLGAAQACASVCRADSDPAAAAAATFLEASAQTLRGEHGRAIKMLEAMAAEPDDGGVQEAVWLLEGGVRAFAYVLLGEFDRAVRLAEETRALSAARGEVGLQGWADYVQALAHLALGQSGAAAERARSALENRRKLPDTWFMALAIDVLALAVAAQGKGERAARLLGIGQHIWQAHGLPQLGARELTDARNDCERRLREALGDQSYESAFHSGVVTASEEGIAYALSAG